MALSDERKDQSILLVDELKSQIAASIFDFKGTREEVADFIKDLKMRVNLMTVEEIFNEFEDEDNS